MYKDMKGYTESTNIDRVDVSNHKNFCILPWMHFYKHTDHSVKLCCIDQGESLGDLHKNSIEEIRNGEKFKEVRKQFLRDERPERCRVCWFKEDNGGKSLRQNDKYPFDLYKNKKWFDETAIDSIIYLDYRTSNLCNFGCKICSPHYSSTLAQAMMSDDFEEVKISLNDGGVILNKDLLKFHKHRVKKDYLDPILNSDLKYIYFAGGEPLLAEEHWYILGELKRKKLYDTVIFYTTNGSILNYKGKNLLEEVKGFSKVMINLSLDGIGDSFDYWRTGGDWKTIQQNLNYIKNFRDNGYANIDLGVNSSVGWMNFNEVFKLHKFLVENEYILSNDASIVSSLLSQPVVSTKGVVLEETPFIFIPELLEYMDEYEKWLTTTFSSQHKPNNPIPFFKNIVDKKEYTPEKLRDWLIRNKKLDKYFKTNFKGVFNFKTKNFSKMLEDFYNDIENCPEGLK